MNALALSTKISNLFATGGYRTLVVNPYKDNNAGNAEGMMHFPALGKKDRRA